VAYLHTGPPIGAHVLALASAQQGQNPTLVLFLIAVVAVAVFWRAIVAFGIAALVVGFVFLLVTIWLDAIHGLHVLIP
jgi:hypothetical protein